MMMPLLKILSKKIFKLISELHDLLLVIFGSIIVIFILFNRLRHRVPKTLPVEISPENIVMYLLLIITVTFMLCLNLYFIFGKEVTKSKNVYLKFLIENYNKSIDKLFNTIEYVLNYVLKKTLKDFCTKNFYRFPQSLDKYKKYVIYIEILPRIIILFLFTVDIFYIKKLHYFYISLLLFLIPLLIRCLLYIMQRIFNDALDNLNNKLDVYIEECNINNDLLPPMSIMYYFEQKMLYNLGKRKDLLRYNINISFKHMKELYKILEITSDQELNSKEIVKFYANIIDNNLLPLACCYTKYNEIKQLLLPKINVLLFGTYLIGWSYIIFTSYKIFPEDYFIFLENIINNEEPFSGCLL